MTDEKKKTKSDPKAPPWNRSNKGNSHKRQLSPTKANSNLSKKKTTAQQQITIPSNTSLTTFEDESDPGVISDDCIPVTPLNT